MAKAEYGSAFGATAFGIAVPSILKLLKYELLLDKTVTAGLRSLQAELKSMHAFLGCVSSLAPDLQLDPQMKLRADEVSDLSHAIETSLHSFLVQIELTKEAHIPGASKGILDHKIDIYIDDTRIKVKELRERHGPYPCKSDLESTCTRKVNPRILAMYTEESNPVGIDGAIDELTKKLSKSDHVSIVGMTGMGKTTLAQAVYDRMKGDFDCWAFVPIGQGAGPLQVLKGILHELRIDVYGNEPDQRQLANQLRKFLVNKRYLIVIDDLWDEETWTLIKHACVGEAKSKIITTSRNRKIPKGVADDDVYNMKPLSTADSKKLLHTKIFGAEDKNHDTDLDKLLHKYLHKWGGVPIAITMIGSLLAKIDSKEWSSVFNSIGSDEHKEDEVFENLRKVMQYSYTELSDYLKGCFLYLSLFPEGHWIEKNKLIWMWVADGLVDDGSFETGETYLKELLDRSMIQWAVSPGDIGQGGCRVHSLMLALIRDLSSSENFSTVLGRKQESTSATRTIHRLAIHQTISQTTSLEVEQVRSFFASTCPGSSLPPLSKFAHVRAIDLVACDLSHGDCELKHLGKLEELKYVGLVGTPIAELPAGKGYFKVLQTLDVTATGIKVLPSFVEELRKLRCLRAGKGTTMMSQVGKLTSLEELWLHSADKSPGFAADLRELTKLRVLVIHFDEVDESMQKKLVESLGHLNKLQVLQIWFDTKGKVRLDGWEENVPYPELRQLLLFGAILSKHTPWIHHLSVPKLSKLLLQVETLEAQHLEILGQMPSLRSLYLHSEEDKYRLSYTANKEEFQVLEYINTNIELICGDGGLPMIQELEIGGIRVGMDVGLQGNMPLLERATYHLDCLNCGPVEVQKAEEELRQVSQAHPNRPAITIRRWNNVELEAHVIMNESMLPELARTIAAASNTGGTASSLLGSDDFVNLISNSIARLLTNVGTPPTLAVDDGRDSRGAPSQGLSHNSKDETQLSTDSMLDTLNSQFAADALSELSTLTGINTTTFMNLSKKFARDPEIIASLNNIKRNRDGSVSGSDISRVGQLIMPDIISHFEQNVDGPVMGAGTMPMPKTTAMLQDMQNSSRGSFKLDANCVLGIFDSMVADNAVPLPVTDRAGCRNMLEKWVQNPETVSCFNSMLQNAAGGSPCGSDFVKLMVPDVRSSMAQKTGRPEKGQDADTNLAGNSSAGLSHKPAPKIDTDSVLGWLNTPDGATFSSGEAARLGMGHVAYLRILEKCLRNPKMITSMGSVAWDGDFSRMPSFLKNNTIMDELVVPDFIDYIAEYADGGGQADDIASISAPLLKSAKDDGGQVDITSSSVTQGIGAPPQESTQKGEEVSRMLRQVLPAVQQELATRASSGQPSTAQINIASDPADAGGMHSGLLSDPALAAQSEMDSVAGSTANVAQSRQDGDNSADGASSGQPRSAQLDDVGNEGRRQHVKGL